MEYATIIIPGLSPKRISVPASGLRLEEVLASVDVLFSNKQTYIDKNGTTLNKDDLVFPNDVVTVTTTVANG
jgi:hypothetical protein